MEDFQTLTELAVIIMGGVIAAFITIKIKMPTIIGYLLAGMVLALLFPDIFSVQGGHEGNSLISNIAQLGAAMLLFTIGIEFSLDIIKHVFRIVIAGALVQAMLTIVFAMIVFPVLGFGDYEAFFLGAMISMSSTAFVLRMLEAKNQLHTRQGNIMLGWLVTQDVLIILWFLLLGTFAPNAEGSPDLILTIIKAAAVIGVTYGIGRYLLPPLLKQVAKAKSEELLLVSVVGTIVLFAVIAGAFGISFTIGAFLAGLALSESFLNHEIFTEVKPLRNLFIMIFFVSVGSLFDLGIVFENLPIVIFVLLVVIPIKILIIIAINLWFKVHVRHSILVGLGISQIGEFAFLAAQIGLVSGWIDSRVYSILIASAIVSMALTPFLYSRSDWVYNFLERNIRRYSPNLHRSIFLRSLKDEERAATLKDHVILCGFGRVGSYIATALKSSDIHFVGIEMDASLAEAKKAEHGADVIYGDATKPEILDQAGVSHARAIVIALPEMSDSSAIVKIAKERNPHIKIVARIHRRGLSLEADHIVEAEFEAAVQIIITLYKIIRRRHKKALDVVRQIKEEGWDLSTL